MAVTGDSLGSSGKDLPINLSTEKALEETMLSPRFYTTDFAAIDKISIEGVREEWDKLMSIDPEKLRMQTLRHEELFLQFSESLPKEMLFERELLVSRL